MVYEIYLGDWKGLEGRGVELRGLEWIG